MQGVWGFRAVAMDGDVITMTQKCWFSRSRTSFLHVMFLVHTRYDGPLLIWQALNEIFKNRDYSYGTASNTSLPVQSEVKVT